MNEEIPEDLAPRETRAHRWAQLQGKLVFYNRFIVIHFQGDRGSRGGDGSDGVLGLPVSTCSQERETYCMMPCSTFDIYRGHLV